MAKVYCWTCIFPKKKDLHSGLIYLKEKVEPFFCCNPYVALYDIQEDYMIVLLVTGNQLAGGTLKYIKGKCKTFVSLHSMDSNTVNIKSMIFTKAFLIDYKYCIRAQVNNISN